MRITGRERRERKREAGLLLRRTASESGELRGDDDGARERERSGAARRVHLERATGFEPATPSLGSFPETPRCSTLL